MDSPRSQPQLRLERLERGYTQGNRRIEVALHAQRGVRGDPKHPAFAAFPTEEHSNWQWWYLVSRAGAMILDGLPQELRPTVQVIDDWFTNRRLGLVFEARVGKGRLLVTSIDLERDLDANVVARQMRYSLLRYAASDRFVPKVEVSPDAVRALMQ